MTEITDKEPYMNYQKLFKEMEKEVSFYRECIELTESLMLEIKCGRTDELTRTQEKLDGPEVISYFFQLDILERTVAHYTLLKKGIVISSYLPLRSIYELLLRMYLFKTNRELAELNCKYEKRESYNEEGRKQIEKEFNKHKKLNREYVEKKIYSEEKIKKFRDGSGKHFYNHLSQMAHPSLQSRSSSLEYHPSQFIDSMKLGISLTVANFVLIFENNEQFIKKENKEKVREMFKEEYPEEFLGLYADFIPDINNDKLKFKTHQDFLNYLEEE